MEKASDENLILFYREEIKRIDEGENATKLLSVRVIRRFLDIDISSNVRGVRARKPSCWHGSDPLRPQKTQKEPA